MTPEQFRNAIRKGLGRAILHLKQNDPQPYWEEILPACLTNTTYDTQCEGTREDYLFEAINLSGNPEPIKQQVAATLLSTTNDRDCLQLFELARLIAARGDSGSRAAIYQRFDANCLRDKQPYGVHAILELDGIDGLIHVMGEFGKRAMTDDVFEPPLYAAHFTELPGLSDLEIRKRVRAASRENKNVRACRQRMIALRQSYARHMDTPSEIQRRASQYSLEDMRAILAGRQKPDGNTGYAFFRKWARLASEKAMNQLAEDFTRETSDENIKRYLSMFMHRPVNLIAQRLLQLTESADRMISHRSFVVLSKIKDQRVRDFAMERIIRREMTGNVLSLLRSNYQVGDLEQILAALPSQPDDDSAHGLGMAIREIADDNPNWDGYPMLLWTVEHNPCALCRCEAIKHLLNSGKAPPALIEESRFDCYEHTRELLLNA